MRKRILAIGLLSIALVLALAIAGGAMMAVADDSEDDLGVAKLPASNVGFADGHPGQGPPDHAWESIPTNAAAWDVHASEYASDLQLQVDVDDRGLVLRATDPANHDGRTIAVDAAALEESLGYSPTQATVEHESGDVYRTDVEYRDGFAIFDVREFSTNEITFGGTVDVSASNATYGTNLSYTIEDASGVDDFDVDLVGETLESSEQESFSDLSDGDNRTLEVGGTEDPTGESLTASGSLETANQITEPNADSVGIGPDHVFVGHDDGYITAYDRETGDQEWENTHGANHLQDIEYHNGSVLYSTSDDVYKVDAATGSEDWSVSTPESSLVVDTDGETVLVGTGEPRVRALSWSSGSDLWSDGTWIDHNIRDVAVGDNYAAGGTHEEVAVWDHDGNEEWTADTYRAEDSLAVADGVLFYSVNRVIYAEDIETRNDVWDFDGASDHFESLEYHNGLLLATASDYHYLLDAETGQHKSTFQDWYPSFRDSDIYTGSVVHPWGYDDGVELKATPSPTIDIGTSSVEFDALPIQGSATKDVTLETGDQDLVASMGHGSVDVDVEWDEATESIDPGLTINGETVAHSGLLEDGQSTTITIDSDLLIDGENDVTVSMTKSETGDSGAVTVGFQHEAVTDQSVGYDATTWGESYDISRTWDDATEGTEITIPFSSDRIVEVRDIELKMNDGEWESLTDTANKWDFDGSTLVVDVDNVEEGDTVGLRATGSKVLVDGGEIEVIEPTTEGDLLNTEFEITEFSEDFQIDVSGTTESDLVHYADEVSWSGADPFARVFSGGNQRFHTPNANAGATATLKTAPLSFTPQTGDADIRVDDPDEPRFQIGPGSSEGDTVDLTWHDATEGDTYDLYSITDERAVDTSTANSPVSFRTADELATYIIESTAGSGGGGGGGVMAPDERTSGIPGFVWLFGAVILSVAGLGLLGNAVSDGRSRSRSAVDRSISLPRVGSVSLPSMPSISTTATGPLIMGGLFIIGLIALEIASGQELIGSIAETSELWALLSGVGALLGIWWLDERMGNEIPNWLMGLAAAITVVYTVETLSPGALLGPLSEGFGTVAPLFWLVLIVGGAYFARGMIRSRTGPDTELKLELPGRDD